MQVRWCRASDRQQLVGPPIELKQVDILRAQPNGDPNEGVPLPDPELKKS